MPIFGVPVHASTHAPGGTDDLFLTQGHMSATRLETCPRYVAGSSQALVSQSMQLSYLTPAAALTVGYLMTFCSTGASGGSVVRFGLYSVAANGDITLVARTANDTTLLNTTSTTYVKALDTTGGFPATYTMVAGQRYALAVLVVGATPSVRGASPALGAIPPAINRVMTLQSDLPTGTTASASLSATSLCPWMGATTNSSGN
jgi:hypothetical protein